MGTPGVLLPAGKPAGRHRHGLKAGRRDPLAISRWHIRLSDFLPLLRLAWRWGTGRHQMLARHPKKSHVRSHVRAVARGLVVGITQHTAACCPWIQGRRQAEAGPQAPRPLLGPQHGTELGQLSVFSTKPGQAELEARQGSPSVWGEGEQRRSRLLWWGGRHST